MPKIRLLAVLNTEKITKNQPVVSGHAPCIKNYIFINHFTTTVSDFRKLQTI